MSRKSFCKRSFHNVSNLKLEDRADGVKNGIYTNATTFAAPPITQAVLTTALTTYSTTRVTYEQGGTAQQPAFTAARKALLNNLDSLATYVDGVAAGNAQIVKLAGFEATFDNTTARIANEVPATPQKVVFKRSETNSGQMTADCEAYPTGYRFITFLTENAPLPNGVVIDANGNITIPAGTSTVAVIINVSMQRKKQFVGLNAGSTYYVYYAVINAKGASGISDAKTAICV